MSEKVSVTTGYSVSKNLSRTQIILIIFEV